MRGALQVHATGKKSCIFYSKSHDNSYQVLQVMHTASKCAIKSKVRMIKEQIGLSKGFLWPTKTAAICFVPKSTHLPVSRPTSFLAPLIAPSDNRSHW